MNPVIHFEMPAEDKSRMATFYSRAFGWQTQQLGSDMGEYVVATTTESDENGRPKKPGTINGGFFQKTAEENRPSQCPLVVIGVEDIREHIKKVEGAGGKVLGEPTEIPGVGWYVSFLDSEGNKVSMLQPQLRRG